MSAFTFTNKFHLLSLGLSLVSAIALSLPQPAVSESLPVGEQQNLPPAQEVDPAPPTSNQPVFDRIIPLSELSQSVTSRLLENASQTLALPISNLQIVSVRQVTWSDGCGGRPVTPDMMCTQAFVDGWIVTLKSGEQELVYETTPLQIPVDNNIIADPPPVIPPPEQLPPPPVQEADPAPPPSNRPVFDGIIPISELRQSIADRILQNASQISALPISNLQIISVRQVTQQVSWPDGCGGRPITPDMVCKQALVNDWTVTVKSGEQEWVYRTDGFRLLLEPDIIMPDISEPNMWGFRNVRAGGNFDPPTAYGFRYKMVSDSLFTEIMEFPTGFAKPFGVLVNDVFIGEFQRGDRVPFSDYKHLLGNLLTDGIGVEEFSVVGLNIDPTNPTAFPLRLDFNTDIASFNMYAIFDEEPQSIPEPGSVFGILTFGTFGAGVLLKRQRQQPK